MKISPFTLVQTFSRPSEPTRAADLPKLGHVKKNLRAAILKTVGHQRSAPAIKTLTHQLSRSKQVITVGVWDLGIWVGGLPAIVEHLNRASDGLTIFEVQAAIPIGLIWHKERIGSWAEKTLRRRLKRSEIRELADAVVDTEFLPVAETVRRNLGVDYLIALTPARIAGEINDEDGHTVHCDFFSSPDSRVSLVSTYQLRELAAETQRPYEYAVALVVLSTLFVLMNSKVQFHESTGCLFDYNYERHSIVSSLRKPMIEESCLRKMNPKYREIAVELIEALADYQKK